MLLIFSFTANNLNRNNIFGREFLKGQLKNFLCIFYQVIYLDLAQLFQHYFIFQYAKRKSFKNMFYFFQWRMIHFL